MASVTNQSVGMGQGLVDRKPLLQRTLVHTTPHVILENGAIIYAFGLAPCEGKLCPCLGDRPFFPKSFVLGPPRESSWLYIRRCYPLNSAYI